MTNSADRPENKFELDYSLSAEGEATVRFSDGAKTVESHVSDLHDNLRDLARMALSIQAGDLTARAVFVVDPGELHLALDLGLDSVRYEVRRFEDWASLQPGPDWQYEILLEGVTTPEAIVGQVKDVLRRLEENPGAERYRELWRQHDFPVEELRRLEERVELSSGRRLNVPALVARAFLVIVVAPPVFAIVYWLCTTVFSIYNLIWVPHIISVLVAAEVGWIAWSRSVSLQTLAGRPLAVALGAILLGGLGFAAGFYWPLIFLPDSLQGPIFGAVGAGFIGLFLGALIGTLFWRIRVGF